MNNWVKHTEIDYTDKIETISIDTRSFHAIAGFEPREVDDIKTLLKHPDFFFTIDEVKDLIQDLFERSGGEKDWRNFRFKGWVNWNFKYIRVVKTEHCYLVGNRDYNFTQKKEFQREVITDSMDLR